MTEINWCEEHDEHESAPGIGYCWLFAVPYTWGGTPCRMVQMRLTPADEVLSNPKPTTEGTR